MSSENTIQARFKEERTRVGLSHAKIADICRVAKTTVISWEKGSKIPSEALAALIPHGFDVIYVLVGRSLDTPQELLCTPDEVELIDEYRNLPEEQQEAVRQMIRALSLQAVRKGTAALVRKPRKRQASDPPGEGP